MNTKKQRLSIRVIQGEGVITISACIPEDQVKNYGKLLWGLIGSGIVWAFSQLPLHPTPPANSPPILPLTSDQQTITDK